MFVASFGAPWSNQLAHQERVAAGTRICSDEWSSYRKLGAAGYDHRSVNHSEEEYARMDPDIVNVHTNTVEGFWASFKIALRNRRGTRRHRLELFARVCGPGAASVVRVPIVPRR